MFGTRALVFALGVPAALLLTWWAPSWLFGAVLWLILLAALLELRALSQGMVDRRGRWSIVPGILCLVLGGHIIALHANPSLGPRWVLLLLAVSWGGEAAAYLVGSTIGRIPLANAVSPGKTVEGALASFIVSMGFVLLIGETLLRDVPWPQLMALGVGGNILAQVGDLVESAYKRACRAKDSGRLLGDQGGILDSIDGLLLASPWVFWVARALVG